MFPKFGLTTEPVNFKAALLSDRPTIMISRLFMNFCLLLQYDKSDGMLYLANFPYKRGSYSTPTEMKVKFIDNLLTTNDKLFMHFSMTDTVNLLQGLQEEAEKSKLNDYDNLFSFIAIDEADLKLRLVFCGINATKFGCETLFEKKLILPDEGFIPGTGKVNSLQVQNDKILVVLPSRIFEFSLNDVKNKQIHYGYSRSMKYIQHFDNRWFGISSGDILFILEHRDDLDRMLMETSFFRTENRHTYRDLVSTGDYLISKYYDEGGSSGLSIFYYTNEDFFQNGLKVEPTSISNDLRGRFI